jgi:hypothetical protein
MAKKKTEEKKKVPYSIWLEKDALERMKVVSEADDTPMAVIARNMIMRGLYLWEERNSDCIQDRPAKKETIPKASKATIMPRGFHLTVELDKTPKETQREAIRAIIDRADIEILRVLEE